jgi:hypothetical protein
VGGGVVGTEEGNEGLIEPTDSWAQ